MARPKFPALNEVLDLACMADLRISQIEIIRQHKRGRFNADVVDALWPKLSNRKRSFLLGQITYVGKFCKKHDCNERYVIGGSCLVCQKQGSAEYSRNNKEKCKLRYKKWSTDNKDYIRIRDKARYQVFKAKALKNQAAA